MNLPRHQFSYVHDEESVCVNTGAVQLDDILRKFEDYLRACGFVFDGHVAICDGTDVCIRKMEPEELDKMLKLAAEAHADLEPTEDGKEGV